MTKQIIGKTLLAIPAGACPVVSIVLNSEIPNRQAYSKNIKRYINGIRLLYLSATIS